MNPDKTVIQVYVTPFLTVASFILGAHYFALPSEIFSTTWGLISVESNWIPQADNATTTADGLFQMTDGTAKLKRHWKGKPWYQSIPIQVLDHVLNHVSKPRGDGIPKYLTQHKGEHKFSEKVDTEYIDLVKSRSLGLPPLEAGLVAGMILLLSGHK